MEVYHVDIFNDTSIGTLELIKDYSEFPPEIKKFCEEKFPNGISKFGYRFLSSVEFINPILGDYLKETFLEYIRQYKYANITSRFESIFASKTLDEANIWLKRLKGFYGNSPDFNPKISVLECDTFFEADAYWRDCRIYINSNEAFNIACEYYNALEYWSGTKSSNPIIELLVPLPAKVIKKIDEKDLKDSPN